MAAWGSDAVVPRGDGAADFFAGSVCVVGVVAFAENEKGAEGCQALA